MFRNVSMVRPLPQPTGGRWPRIIDADIVFWDGGFQFYGIDGMFQRLLYRGHRGAGRARLGLGVRPLRAPRCIVRVYVRDGEPHARPG